MEEGRNPDRSLFFWIVFYRIVPWIKLGKKMKKTTMAGNIDSSVKVLL
jgi:hypothetical protein